MSKIFIHALEGPPEGSSPDYQGHSERDIRVRYLITGTPKDPAPWRYSSDDLNGIVLVPSRKGGTPKFDEVYFRFIPDGKKTAQELKNGNIDFAVLTDPKTIGDFEKPHESQPPYTGKEGRSGLDRRQNRNPEPPLGQEERRHFIRRKLEGEFCVWHQEKNLNIFYLGFHWDKPPFQNNNNLRKALTCAIDRTGVGFGIGCADPAVGPVPPGMSGHDPKTHSQEPFSKANANKYYDQSHRKPTKLTLVYNDANTFSNCLADLVCNDIQANLPIKVERQPVPGWKPLVKAVKNGEGDMFIYSWHQRKDHGNPYDLLRNLFCTNSPANLTKYHEKEFDDALDRKDYDLAQDLILGNKSKGIPGDQPMVFLAHWKRTAVWNKRVRDLQLVDGALPKDQLVDAYKE